MKIINRRTILKELKRAGYVYLRHNGSHAIYKKGDSVIPVPIHLNPCIAIRLHKEIEENMKGEKPNAELDV